ncbi:hypothetical protein Ancab_004239 [Ancistrocladus abbreviatus]
MMQVDVGNRGPAFTVMSSNISAATFMASTSLALTSLIGTLVGSSSNSQLLVTKSFAEIQRHPPTLSHSSLLMFPVDYVEGAVIMGSLFWVVGLRAIYFASTLLLWVFGPIPMFVSSVCMVMMLHILDTNKNPLHDFHQLNRQNPSMKSKEEVTAVTATGSMTDVKGKEADFQALNMDN